MDQIKRTKRKILLLLCALFTTLAVAGGMVFIPEAGKSPAGQATEEFLHDFEARDVPPFLKVMEFPLPVSINGEQQTFTEQKTREMLERVYRTFASIDLDPGEFLVEMNEAKDAATVKFRFHWTVRSRFFDGPPRTYVLRA